MTAFLKQLMEKNLARLAELRAAEHAASDAEGLCNAPPSPSKISKISRISISKAHVAKSGASYETADRGGFMEPEELQLAMWRQEIGVGQHHPLRTHSAS